MPPAPMPPAPYHPDPFAPVAFNPLPVYPMPPAERPIETPPEVATTGPAPTVPQTADWSVASFTTSRGSGDQSVAPEPAPVVEAATPEPAPAPVVESPPAPPIPPAPPVELSRPRPRPAEDEAPVILPWAPEPTLESPPVTLGQRLPVRIDEDDDEHAQDEISASTPDLVGPEPPAPEPVLPADSRDADRTVAYRPMPARSGAWNPPEPADENQQYPIPPAYNDDRDQLTGPVPTWAFRAPSPTSTAAAAPALVGELTLDPMSLRRRVTIRAGASSLTVDESKLLMRAWWRRSEISWSDVQGFEPRFDGASASGGGRLVALTHSGPRELPATKRSLADLRYLHALLDAYRQRAQMMAGR
jgi:homeobox protein ESX1